MALGNYHSTPSSVRLAAAEMAGSGLRVYRFADSIHRLGHGFRIVTRDVFGYGLRVNLASRLLQPTGQPLGFSENLIGNRNRSFHTQSITKENCTCK